MNNTTSSTFFSPDLNHLSVTLAELYQEGVAEISACMEVDRKLETLWDEDKNPAAEIFPEAGFPCRNNPFDATMVAFNRSSSKLTMLLSLLKPLVVVAEIYDPYGRFVKRLFNEKIGRGLTELVCLGCRQRKGPFILLLSSSEGMRSFRIKIN
jgi:hypothetical protein